MKKSILAAALMVGASMVSMPASAAVIISFDPGASSPSAGYVPVNTFNTAAEQAAVTGVNYQFCTGTTSGVCAAPSNSAPQGTPYLAVGGGGNATVNLGLVSSFQFDYGSIDSFNTLTIFSTGANPIIIPGVNFANAANGNQTAPGTNGLFTVSGDAGELFTSINFASSQNAIEIDNVAAIQAVPEPATWAMMLLGFGGIGFAMRRRKDSQQSKRFRLSYS